MNSVCSGGRRGGQEGAEAGGAGKLSLAEARLDNKAGRDGPDVSVQRVGAQEWQTLHWRQVVSVAPL